MFGSITFLFIALFMALGGYFMVPMGFFIGAALTLPLTLFLLLESVIFGWKESSVNREQTLTDDIDDVVTVSADAFLPTISQAALKREEEEIEDIRNNQIPHLIEMLPEDSWHTFALEKRGEDWVFSFHAKSSTHRFMAFAERATASEAFAEGRRIFMSEIDEWHRTRWSESATELMPVEKVTAPRGPRVLIVDDDVDVAMSLKAMFQRFGCESEIVTQHEGLHRKMSFDDVDYIFLDWMLNDHVVAGTVMEKAIRLISTFSDLRDRFQKKRPQVVTYSALEAGEVQLPRDGKFYFDHVAHWQKPMGPREVSEKFKHLIEAHA